MSATRAADFDRVAREFGAAAGLAKPFDAEAFLPVVARVAGRTG